MHSNMVCTSNQTLPYHFGHLILGQVPLEESGRKKIESCGILAESVFVVDVAMLWQVSSINKEGSRINLLEASDWLAEYHGSCHCDMLNKHITGIPPSK